MKILVSTFTSGDSDVFTQKIVESNETDLAAALTAHEELETPVENDRFTTINEHGIFINSPGDLVESWVVIG